MCGIHGYVGTVPMASQRPTRAHVRDALRDGFIAVERYVRAGMA